MNREWDFDLPLAVMQHSSFWGFFAPSLQASSINAYILLAQTRNIFAAQSPSALCSMLLWRTCQDGVTAGVKYFMFWATFLASWVPLWKVLHWTSWRMVFSSNCGVLRRLSCLRPFFSGRRKNLHQLCNHCSCLMRADIVEVIRDWFTSVTLLLKCSLYLKPLGFLFLITIFCHL